MVAGYADGDDGGRRRTLEIRENIVTERFECRPTAVCRQWDRSTNAER